MQCSCAIPGKGDSIRSSRLQAASTHRGRAAPCCVAAACAERESKNHGRLGLQRPRPSLWAGGHKRMFQGDEWPERKRREAGVAGAKKRGKAGPKASEQMESRRSQSRRATRRRRSAFGSIAWPATSSPRTWRLRTSESERVPRNSKPSASGLSQEMLQWQTELREAVLCRPHLLNPVPWPQ